MTDNPTDLAEKQARGDEDFTAERVTAARAFIIAADPDSVVLRIETAGGIEHNFIFKITEFARFAAQVAADAALLSAPTGNPQ